MKIFIGADHRGFDLKKTIVGLLKSQGHEVVDVGTHEEGVACDYPQFSYEVATRVVKNADSRGILLCMTGIGHSIAANKVPGAYAALVYSKEAAMFSREHNNANILVLGSRYISENEMIEIIELWLKTAFEGGRHLARVEKIKTIEREFLK
ncbi:MAG: ribose 5-phosphate isomerase B [Candidatus Omnitrophica bacterium]|nr:ribose 5-phosphate isomerase B [Candidatus Omnitrophota bacterium]